MSSLLVAKKCLEEVGGFDEKVPGRYSEDLDLFLRISEKFPIGYVPESLVLYRRHTQNTTLRGQPHELAVCDLYIFEAAMNRRRDLWRSLGKLERKALCDMAFFAGWSTLNKGNHLLARSYFRKALKFRRYSALCWMHFIGTWLPVRVLRRVRQFRRTLLRGSVGGP